MERATLSCNLSTLKDTTNAIFVFLSATVTWFKKSNLHLDLKDMHGICKNTDAEAKLVEFNFN